MTVLIGEQEITRLENLSTNRNLLQFESLLIKVYFHIRIKLPNEEFFYLENPLVADATVADVIERLPRLLSLANIVLLHSGHQVHDTSTPLFRFQLGPNFLEFQV